MRFQRHIIRAIFVLSIIGFIVINLNLWSQIGIIPYGSSKQYVNLRDDTIKQSVRSNDAVEVIDKRVSLTLTVNNYNRSKQHVATVASVEVVSSTTNLLSFVESANKKASLVTSQNTDLSKISVVIIVQVHKRAEYLAQLILSLSKSRFINETLLVFSHDFVSDEINQLVNNIKFCQVLQIFFPHSIQLFPKKFPGTDPNDCPRDATREEALKKNCNNAHHPDKYGHYREASYCQTKHHWFWKINQVFDHLPATKDFQGPVLLLEEDHYVAEDFIYMLRLMHKHSAELCPDCTIFTLGNYDKNPSLIIFNDKVTVTEWISSKHNMGMSMNRQVWNRIKACAQTFCVHDDYNWDWTLQFISTSCISERLKVITSKFARIFHIGECGIHHKGNNCEPRDKIGLIEALIAANRNLLYPDSLTLIAPDAPASQVPKPNGGWGDVRDHELCMSFVASNTFR